MDTRTDGPVLGVLAAHENSLRRQKMMTSQVVQCLQLQCREKSFLAAKTLNLRKELQTTRERL